jgi:hypothetical protein
VTKVVLAAFAAVTQAKVPLTVTVPDCNRKVGLLLFAPTRCEVIVRPPERLTAVMVEVTVTVWEEVGTIVPAMLIDAAFTVPKPEIVPVVLAAARLGNESAFVTVRTIAVFTVRVEPLPTVIELQVLAPSTVKVNPAPITMSSVAAGMTPPGHGAFTTVELQLPDPVVVIVAALDTPNVSKTNMKSRFTLLHWIKTGLTREQRKSRFSILDEHKTLKNSGGLIMAIMIDLMKT